MPRRRRMLAVGQPCHCVNRGQDGRALFPRRLWSEAIGFGPFHFINVQRYIEANAVAAGLVKRAEDWKWSSLWERETRGRSLLDPSPLILPDDWLEQVNRPRLPDGSDPYIEEEEIGEGSDPPTSRIRRDRTRALPRGHG